MAPYPEIPTIVTTGEAAQESRESIHSTAALYYNATSSIKPVYKQVNILSSVIKAEADSSRFVHIRCNDDGLRNLLRVESQSVQELGTVYTSWPLQLAKPK